MLCAARRVWQMATMAAVMCVCSPAFAGQPATTALDRNLQSVFAMILDILKGPLVLGIASIFFLGSLLMMLMGAGGDGVQKLVKIVLVLAAMTAAPAILSKLWTAMGGLV